MKSLFVSIICLWSVSSGCHQESTDRQAVIEIYKRMEFVHSINNRMTISQYINDSKVTASELCQQMVIQDSLDRWKALANLDTLQSKYERDLKALGSPANEEQAGRLFSELLQANEGQVIIEQTLRFEIATLKIWQPGMSSTEAIGEADSVSKYWYNPPPNQSLKPTLQLRLKK